MNISNHFLQKYYPTRKLYAWALALIYIAPISLLAAQQKKEEPKEEQIKIFIKEDLKTLYTKQSNNGKITENDLKSTWAKKKLNATKANSPKQLIDALKKDFNPGDLTLEILAGFYEDSKKKDNIKFITAILQAQNDDDKKKVTENIMKELQKGGDAWEHLETLLNSREKELSALNLSYETIDLSFNLLFQHSDNDSCEFVIQDMVDEQPKKGTQFIIEALKHTNDRRAWILLDAVFEGLYFGDLDLKDELELELKNQLELKKEDDKPKSIEALLVDKYLAGMQLDVDVSYVLDITKKILAISATAERFAKEACNRLATSDDQDSIKAIWKILGKLVKDSKIELELKLQELPYNKLVWNLDGAKSILKKLLSKQNRQTAQLVASKAFKDNNQNPAYFWSFLSFLIMDKNGPKVDATQIDATKMTPKTALKGAKKYSATLMKILKQDKATALALVKKAFTVDDNQKSNRFWRLLKCLITDTDGPQVDATQIDATKMTLDTALKGAKINYFRTLMEILKQNQNKARALTLSKEAFAGININSYDTVCDLLHCLIVHTDGPKVDAQQINIQKFDEELVFHAFSTQGMKKDVIESLLRSHPNQAKELVKKILSNQNLLSTQNIELLYWLIFDSHTNNQGAIVPPTAIDITSQRAIEILRYLQSQPNQRLSDIVKSAINIQPSIGKGMLEIAINNSQTGSSLNWSNANVDFDLLHLLMLDPNGPRLTIERADVGNLDLSAIESHISKPNALELFKKILHNLKNIETFNAFRYAIFPSNSNSNNTFDYQNVDWDTTKWDSIPTLKELIKSIDIPEDIVVKKLQDDGFTHKAIVKDIVLTSSSNLLEKVLNIAFPNVTVTSTTPTPTIAWPQSLSETNWDIVASLTDSQHGIITAKEVIQKVVPGISSSDAHFARDYDLSSVRWGDFDWEAFEDLAERSNIANFSTQNYQTIAENVLPGLQFVDQAPKVSQIRWSEVKSYKVVNFLIAKKIISEKILINAPRSLLKQRINNISRLSLAEADFWKDAQEEKSKYYWSFAPYVVGFVLASSIALLYAFNKQTKKQTKKRGSHNKESLKKEAKVKTRHSINNRQFHKIRSS